MDHIIIKQPKEFDSFDESELLKRYTSNVREIQEYVDRVSEISIGSGIKLSIKHRP